MSSLSNDLWLYHTFKKLIYFTDFITDLVLCGMPLDTVGPVLRASASCCTGASAATSAQQLRLRPAPSPAPRRDESVALTLRSTFARKCRTIWTINEFHSPNIVTNAEKAWEYLKEISKNISMNLQFSKNIVNEHQELLRHLATCSKSCVIQLAWRTATH